MTTDMTKITPDMPLSSLVAFVLGEPDEGPKEKKGKRKKSEEIVATVARRGAPLTERRIDRKHLVTFSDDIRAMCERHRGGIGRISESAADEIDELARGWTRELWRRVSEMKKAKAKMTIEDVAVGLSPPQLRRAEDALGFLHLRAAFSRASSDFAKKAEVKQLAADAAAEGAGSESVDAEVEGAICGVVASSRKAWAFSEEVWAISARRAQEEEGTPAALTTREAVDGRVAAEKVARISMVTQFGVNAAAVVASAAGDGGGDAKEEEEEVTFLRPARSKSGRGKNWKVDKFCEFASIDDVGGKGQLGQNVIEVVALVLFEWVIAIARGARVTSMLHSDLPLEAKHVRAHLSGLGKAWFCPPLL